MVEYIHNSKLSYTEKFATLKITLEAPAANYGKSWIYNKEANSPFDVMFRQRMQCYSGTVIHTLAWRLGGKDYYQKQNPVVIYESGHILTGYMVPNKSGKFEMFGIETTVEGKAIKKYGLTEKLNQPIRIIDGDFFFIVGNLQISH